MMKYIILLGLLLTGCQMYETFLTRQVNERFTENIEDISGDINIYHIVIGRNGSSWTGVGYSVGLYCQQSESNDSDLSILGVRIYYNGSSWKFIEGITLRTDDELIRLSSNNPSRQVIGNGVIESLYLPILYENHVENLVKTSTLSFQLNSDYREDIIEVSPTTINSIREFFNDYPQCSNYSSHLKQMGIEKPDK